MKKIMSKILDLPTSVYAGIGFIIFFGIFLYTQGSLTVNQVLWVAIIVLYGVATYSYGSALIKGTVSVFVMLYLNSITSTGIMIVTQDYFVQPFMITILIYALFLSFTYSTKHLNYGMRSRWLWATILTTSYSLLKIFLIADLNINYILVELFACLYSAIFIALWLLWLNKSKNTKVNAPNVISVDSNENYVYIAINESINSTFISKTRRTFKWASSQLNAYPWLFEQAVKAYDEGKKTLIIYTKHKSSVENIVINRPSTSKKLNIIIQKAP